MYRRRGRASTQGEPAEALKSWASKRKKRTLLVLDAPNVSLADVLPALEDAVSSMFVVLVLSVKAPAPAKSAPVRRTCLNACAFLFDTCE